MQFPLVSDFNRQVVRQFGIDYTEDEPYTGWWGMARRSVFVIDPDAIIRYAWITDDPLIAPNIEEALNALQALSS